MIKKSLKFIKYLAVILLLILVSLVFYFHPILIQPPRLTGLYGVGTHSFQCVDSSRHEIHYKEFQKNREFPIRLYYPSTEHKSPKASYLKPYFNAISILLSKKTSIPKNIWAAFFSNIHYHAQSTALPDKKFSYPVILFSPGIGSTPLHASYLEELASWGYIVVDVSHSYDMEPVVYAYNQVISLSPELTNAIARSDRDAIYKYRTQAHTTWLVDLECTFNFIQKLNQSGRYHKMFDLNNVGVLGHSHGGGVAIDLCKTQEWCKAGIDMDGWTKTANTPEGFQKPFLFLLNADGLDEIDELLKNMNPETSKKILIHDGGHNAFSDYILLKPPLAWLLGATKKLTLSTQSQLEIRRIICNHIRTFFDTYLKEINQAM